MTTVPVKVEAGEVTIEAISGRVTADALFLYLTTLEKNVGIEAVYETGDETAFRVFMTDTSLRDGKRVSVTGQEPATIVTIGGGFACEASASRYTIRVVGVRVPPVEELYTTPFNEVPR